MPAILPPDQPQGQFTPLDTHVQLTAGNDAKVADGTALSWYSASWPNLAGATLRMIVGHASPDIYGNLPVTWTAQVPSSPSSPSAIHFEVAGSLTVDLPADQYDYQLSATLADGDTITLAQGHLSVFAAPGQPLMYPTAI